MNECVFCTSEEVASRTVADNDAAFAFLTHAPIVPGHALVCPKRCVPRMDDLTDDERTEIEKMRVQIKRALERTFEAEGFNFAWNEGEKAGQTVAHVHLHVVPRKAGDAGVTQCEPRTFLYRPNSREPSPHEELRRVASLVRDNLV